MHDTYTYELDHRVLTMPQIQLTDKILWWSFVVFVMIAPITGIIVAAITGKY